MLADGYLYGMSSGTLLRTERTYVPLRSVANLLGAEVDFVDWDSPVTVRDGTEQSWTEEDFYWLSGSSAPRAEGEPLLGQLAVGTVVLNRVADPAFPNTVEGVLAQKNQFSSYRTGAMANTKPSQGSVIAAKLVLDGGVVEETKGALFFDSGVNSWAARNKRHIATIGGHKFYG